jgi:hypothetical protein
MRVKGAKPEKKVKRNIGKELRDQIKAHKSTFVVYCILRVLVIIVGIRAFFMGNYEHAMLCVLSLVLFLMPAFVSKNFGIEIPSAFEIIVLLFIFAAEILGEISCFYLKFAYWDTMLHTINGFMCAALGFSLVDILNRSTKFRFRLSPFFLAFVAFCFSMTIGVLWEFFEFTGDKLLMYDMQKDTVVNYIASVEFDPTHSNTAVTVKNIVDTIIVTADGQQIPLSDYGIHGYLDIGLNDTMKDLIVNFVGAVSFSIIGYLYVKSRGKRNRFAKGLIPTVKENLPKVTSKIESPDDMQGI